MKQEWIKSKHVKCRDSCSGTAVSVFTLLPFTSLLYYFFYFSVIVTFSFFYHSTVATSFSVAVTKSQILLYSIQRKTRINSKQTEIASTSIEQLQSNSAQQYILLMEMRCKINSITHMTDI